MLSTLPFLSLCENFKVKNKMAFAKMGDKRIVGQYSVYNPPTSNLDFTKGLEVTSMKTHPHPRGQ